MSHRLRLEPIVSTLPQTDTTTPASDWRNGLPTLSAGLVTLRELRIGDAASLFVSLTTPEVSRFISPPPRTVAGFERFIDWTLRQRAAGLLACFVIVPRGTDQAVGVFQVRSLGPRFDNAEWGFAMSADYWGTGMFVDGARLTVDFAFDAIGVHRLEARAALANGRGSGALRKIGAVQEGVLRGSFPRDGAYHDQALWTILREDWYDAKGVWGPPVVLH